MPSATKIHFPQSAQGRPARFATSLTFGETLMIDQAASHVNASMNAGCFSWGDDRGRNTLAVLTVVGGFEARHALN